MVAAAVRSQQTTRRWMNSCLGCGGEGYSVRQVIDTAAQVTGRRIPVEIAPRRPGDPAVLIASSERIGGALGWRPRHQELETIISSAWRWMQQTEARGQRGDGEGQLAVSALPRSRRVPPAGDTDPA